ncbi:Heat shock protein [Echinococcus granulosus]|uniref:Heat shock protein n=1 Tax=Echinococcus granulosus TaxID=6210 RepID=W6U2M6_ECHGR|nr:Heat shock protein [Echinococcus granulosus]EUB54806.1 Heat shock protein [Echinococcus granulosus]
MLAVGTHHRTSKLSGPHTRVSACLAIRVDLGANYSYVEVFQYPKVSIIINYEAYSSTLSYVAFVDKEHFIGDATKNQAALFEVKRLIRRLFNDEEIGVFDACRFDDIQYKLFDNTIVEMQTLLCAYFPLSIQLKLKLR